MTALPVLPIHSLPLSISANGAPDARWYEYWKGTSDYLRSITGSVAVPQSRNLVAGEGLTGGGDLSADRTFNVGAGTGIQVNSNDIEVLYGTSAGTAAQGNDSRILGAFQTSSAAALTRANDTNVTLTLSGSPTTALVNAATITAGWTGTLAAGRLNGNVVQGITNDTNVTGSITAQVLTLGWTGTLAAGRLNNNVVQGITNDTNVTGSISAQNLTLGWTGTLAAGRLNSNVVQSVTNDTNVTGSISAQNLQLSWSGTLAAGRLNSNVVQSVVNDTNVTGSISAQALTLGWTGTLATARIGDDAVTFAKMQNIATDRLIGRDTASSGDPEEITVGGGIEFTTSGGIQTSAFTGDVTKSAGGTALTIPNDTVTYAKMQNVSATDKLLGRSSSGSGDVEEIACTAAGRALLDDANAAAQRATLDLEPGVDVQAYSADLDAALAAWVVFSPTVTALTGTFTSVTAGGKYRKIGKTVFFTVTISITTNGTAADYIKCSLPFAPSVEFTAYGGEEAIHGQMIQGRFSGGSDLRIYKFDNSYPGGDGAYIIISGCYETS